MAKFSIQFEDPLPEVTGGVKIKSNWDPRSWGSVSVTETGLAIEGSSRLSTVERIFSVGVLGEILVKTFFQSTRHRTQDLPTGDILRAVAATKSKPTILTTGTTLTNDIMHIFAQKADGSRDIHSFSFYTPSASLVSRPALWLFWGFLTRILSSDKLELQTQELNQEVRLETHSWEEEEMQSRIATAFFKALLLIEGNQQLFNQAGDFYKDLFGAAGRQIALTMLSAEDWRIRATAVSCLSKIGETSDADVLLSLLRDPHSLVRVATVQSLVRFPSDKTYQALQVVSQNADRSVRRAAQDALRIIAKTK